MTLARMRSISAIASDMSGPCYAALVAASATRRARLGFEVNGLPILRLLEPARPSFLRQLWDEARRGVRELRAATSRRRAVLPGLRRTERRPGGRRRRRPRPADRQD